jgi:hypothetical protein
VSASVVAAPVGAEDEEESERRRRPSTCCGRAELSRRSLAAVEESIFAGVAVVVASGATGRTEEEDGEV